MPSEGHRIWQHRGGWERLPGGGNCMSRDAAMRRPQYWCMGSVHRMVCLVLCSGHLSSGRMLETWGGQMNRQRAGDWQGVWGKPHLLIFLVSHMCTKYFGLDSVFTVLSHWPFPGKKEITAAFVFQGQWGEVWSRGWRCGLISLIAWVWVHLPQLVNCVFLENSLYLKKIFF